MEPEHSSLYTYYPEGGKSNPHLNPFFPQYILILACPFLKGNNNVFLKVIFYTLLVQLKLSNRFLIMNN